MNRNNITSQEWSDFNEKEKLFFINSINLKNVLEAEGWKKGTTFRNDLEKFIRKGEIIEVFKRSNEKHFYYKSQDDPASREKTVIDILSNHEPYGNINKLRHYATTWIPEKYTQFLMAFPKISKVVLYHLNRVSNEKEKQVPRTYQAAESNFLSREVSLFKLAVKLGYKVKSVNGSEHEVRNIAKQVSGRSSILEVVKGFFPNSPRWNSEENHWEMKSPFESGSLMVMKGNSFYCQGSRKSGDAISFLMEYEKMDFEVAVKKLAEQYKINFELKEERVYYVREVNGKLNSKISIYRNGETGLYSYRDYIKQNGGNAIALVEDVKGLKREDATLYVIRFAMQVLPEEKLEEFRKEVNSASNFDLSRNLPGSLFDSINRLRLELHNPKEISKESSPIRLESNHSMGGQGL